jgi:hypothetical protein
MKYLLATAAAIGLLSGPASANIMFTAKDTGGIGEVNVLFQAPETGTTLDHAQVDHTGAVVTFDSLTGQTLNQVAQGNADITCASNCVDNSAIHTGFNSQLSSIEMTAGLSAGGKPTAWTDAIINLNNGTGTALVTVTDNFGAPFTYVLGTGQNFLTMIASGGEFITDIKVTNDVAGSPFGFDDFKQPRVSGLCELGVTGCQAIVGVSEPGSLALLGTGLLGLLGFTRWRRRNNDDNGPNFTATA